MITAEPKRRASRIDEIIATLRQDVPADDLELLLAFAHPILAETSDRVLFGRSAEVMAARTREQFHFFAREIPPPFQLHKGLPGIHVVARQLDEPRDAGFGHGPFLRRRMTAIQTHTLDAPFIFESLKNYFRKAGLRVFSAVHPILRVRRRWERIISLSGVRSVEEEGTRELLCDFRIEPLESDEQLRHVQHEIYSVLKGLFAAVDDFSEMQQVVKDLRARIRPRRRDGQVESPRAFLEWLGASNYIFMGTARYRFTADGRAHRLEDSSLGVLKEPDIIPVLFPGLLEEVEAHLCPADDDDRTIDVDYCNNASAIYHIEPIDDIGVREWTDDGVPKETTLLLGRFAMGAFTQNAGEIPLIREKLVWLENHAGAALANSYAQRETRAVFNRFPMRELFYARPAQLKPLIERIAYMTGDEELVVSVRPGAGYVALHAVFSRYHYSYQVEEGLRAALAHAFGPISFLVNQDIGSNVLMLFYFDTARLEHALEEDAARRVIEPVLSTWTDQTARALEEAFGESDGRRAYRRFVTVETRSGMYREATPPAEVPGDVRHLEMLEGQLEVDVVPRTPESVLLKVYSPHVLALTSTLRMLTNLGLIVTEDLRVPIALPDGRRCLLYRFEVEAQPERIARLCADSGRFADALRALDERRASDGSLNEFVLIAGLTWREVEALRALRNHLLQIRLHYAAETVNAVLLRNPDAAVALFRCFAARFDPAQTQDRDVALSDARSVFRKALDRVPSLYDDEVLRAFDNLVQSAVRTNFYQRPERSVISIKVDSRRVEVMPSPKPMYEIYVHSPRLQGIHLRGGKVARGGLRWSDRHDDFRAEVLGLMKTQMVKNSIIVPVGSKGGFVLKGDLPPRPALDAYLVDRYREYISGLLDLTDNREAGQVIHPPDVICYDGEDPYLVVAADKGTAHLSDVANAVAEQYGSWLGDAFASGGSAGYDHKKVGITARGAWECVRHHFRNLGTDVQREAFSVVAIGDMAGDVFGNGMLRSRTTRLVAAFNHVHIFLDPNPDPEASFHERERLFRLPRSAWTDYDRKLISVGGGVYERSAKSIALSPEARSLLDLDEECASGEEVIRRILTAEVDLLYNGGIGTYVKSIRESHAQVGDRTNDRVRVEARDVRARVASEGGNLGFTQKARLEYAARGGLINTDAIDNSGGVDISDHEVNIKILLAAIVQSGAIASRAERNRILLDMQDEVAELVLADNRAQARALTLDGLRSRSRYEEFVALIDEMEQPGALNRTDDSIPSRDELLASPFRESGLPRPLLALLLGHTKIWACERALKTDLPEGDTCRPFLSSYFPRRMQREFADAFEAHPLRREIIATQAVNYVVNNAGVTFLSRVTSASGAEPGRVIEAYLSVDRLSGAMALRTQLLGAGLSAEKEHESLLSVEERVEELTRIVLAEQSAVADVTAYDEFEAIKALCAEPARRGEE
jgi:glutamate dehydrogenase